jgi:hypothetical protein
MIQGGEMGKKEREKIQGGDSNTALLVSTPISNRACSLPSSASPFPSNISPISDGPRMSERKEKKYNDIQKNLADLGWLAMLKDPDCVD